MINGLISLYMPSYAVALVYMLQSTEYQARPYLSWYWRTANFSKVAKRRTLDRTKSARLLLLALWLGMALQVALGGLFIIMGLTDQLVGGVSFGAALIVAYPVVWAHLVTIPLLLGRLLIAKPKERRLVKDSHRIFGAHPATTIAVAGSYGKTTMKEILLAVLGEGKKVAATPANKNVAVSHAAFAAQLNGDEDIVIVEYGEGKPGDVESFARTTQPDIGLITGVAPAHLDHYKTTRAAGEDIFSLATYLKGRNVFINGESPEAKEFIKPSYQQYNASSALGWSVSSVKINIQGVSFVMAKGSQRLSLHSQLLGRHQVGSLALAAALAHKLGLSKEQIIAGVAKTKPFEHRMQPYQLAGAWVIDDTYNGNIEGMKAGLALLGELDFARKIYVTPGLVDQGKETKRVHIELGRAIGAAQPDKVVLMSNSVTSFIREGMKQGHYKGEITIEKSPVNFYTNLDQMVAVGDVVLMQNDWTDNYS